MTILGDAIMVYKIFTSEGRQGLEKKFPIVCKLPYRTQCSCYLLYLLPLAKQQVSDFDAAVFGAAEHLLKKKEEKKRVEGGGKKKKEDKKGKEKKKERKTSLKDKDKKKEEKKERSNSKPLSNSGGVSADSTDPNAVLALAKSLGSELLPNISELGAGNLVWRTLPICLSSLPKLNSTD